MLRSALYGHLDMSQPCQHRRAKCLGNSLQECKRASLHCLIQHQSKQPSSSGSTSTNKWQHLKTPSSKLGESSTLLMPTAHCSTANKKWIQESEARHKKLQSSGCELSGMRSCAIEIHTFVRLTLTMTIKHANNAHACVQWTACQLNQTCNLLPTRNMQHLTRLLINNTFTGASSISSHPFMLSNLAVCMHPSGSDTSFVSAAT